MSAAHTVGSTMSKQKYNPDEDHIDYDALSKAGEAGEYSVGEVWTGADARPDRDAADGDNAS
jgi:hypothetical protein